MAGLIANEGEFLTKDIDRSLYTMGAYPIDAKSLFNDYNAAKELIRDKTVNAGEKGQYYFGQQVCVVNSAGVNWYVIVKGSDGLGDLQPLGASVRIDEETKHWIIDGHDTGVVAEGKNGEPGQPGPKGDPGDPGQKGDPGESGIAAPVSGFFTVGVDEDGNLYAYSADGKTTPGLKYNSADGGLYADVAGFQPILLGYVRGPKGDKGDPGESFDGKDKVDKLSPLTNAEMGAYIGNKDGTMKLVPVTSLMNSYTIAYRNKNGQCQFSTPTSDEHAANKQYVDAEVKKMADELAKSLAESITFEVEADGSMYWY